MDVEQNPAYQAYIRSPEWERKRQQAFDFYGRACSECGSTKYLEVHHRTYVRFRRESVEDLQVVCGDCHPFVDVQRKHQEREKKDWPMMEKWALETYGPNWWERECDPRDMLERFQAARVEMINDFFADPMKYSDDDYLRIMSWW